ncbi:low specificity L-threonine aldolase [Halobacteriales archaeon QS_1_68_20]|nr:MAG: low specificity L-threonine aldolase [Halobacteriales archaeon QS_1_68_20]
MNEDAIDLRSDTVTRPSAAMREAAADAEVGDDVYGEDPTINDLQARAADLLGTEAALYFPSGTMANQAAIRVHVDRGQEVLCDRWSHVYNYEVSGLAQHAAAQPRPVDGDRGVPSPEQIEDAYVEPGSHHAPGTGLVALENTHNHRGGLAIDPERIDDAARAARDLGLPVHLDGARLWNAAVARDVPVERYGREVDTVMVALSKGLGAPVGSILAGPEDVIAAARDVRKLLGGGMRQAGIVAAPGIEALSNVDRLAEDHENAQVLAEGLAGIEGLSVTDPETNIVIADVSETGMDVHEFGDRCREAGVLHTDMGEYRARFVTHWDVTREDVETAVDCVREVVA